MFLFVYGTLRKGMPYHYFLEENGTYRGDGVAWGYALYDRSGLPCMALCEEKLRSVKGEVYSVSQRVAERITAFEEEAGYLKVPVYVELTRGRKLCYAFVWQHAVNPEKIIQSGDWKEEKNNEMRNQRNQE